MTNFSENFRAFTANRFAKEMWGGAQKEKAVPTDVATYREQIARYKELNLIRAMTGDPEKDKGRASIVFEDYSRIVFTHDGDKGIEVTAQTMGFCCDILKNEIKDEGFDSAIKRLNSFICHRSDDGDSSIIIFKDFSIAFIENKKVVKTSDSDQNINIIFGRLFN